ncbi:MAG: CHAT domain-containing protein [Candidatus Eisenbacteria bacterium]|nr:CHAT domain-containing protein [Candidatus Eisenbacteria bacterium]
MFPLANGGCTREISAFQGPSTQELLRRANALSPRADSLREVGALPAAIDLLEDQLHQRRRLLPARSPEIAESLIRLAKLQKQARRPDDAMLHYREAVSIYRESFGPNSPEELLATTGIANLHRLARNQDSALVLFDQVLRTRRAREADAQAAGDRDAAAAEGGQIAELLFDIGVTLTPQGDWRRAEAALGEAVERQRAAGTGERLQLARSLGSHGTALRHLGRADLAVGELLESARLFEQLRSETAPGMERAMNFSLSSYDMLAAAQLEFGQETAAWQSLEKARARPLVETMTARAAIDTTDWGIDGLSRVRAALGPKDALIGWLAVRPGATAEEYPFWCYSIRRDKGLAWYRVDAVPHAQSASDLSLDALRRELVRTASWPLHVEGTEEVDRLGRETYTQRFAPLEADLRGVDHLIVVAPDLNHGAPITTWIDPQGNSLLDRFRITYAGSAYLYAHLVATQSSRRPPPAWRALILADSQESGGSDRPPLGAAIAEVRSLAALAGPSTVLLDSASTLAQLRDMAKEGQLTEYQLIHFAAHAIVDPLWVGRTGIVLSAGHDERESETSSTPGLVAVHDILDTWSLDADLVTLSACESALGPHSLNDGFLGLHHALMGAGARRVIASLWPVDDRATSLLMGRFYRLLLADGAADEATALRAAGLWLREWRDDSGTQPYRHPIYWAGFILLAGGGVATRPGSSGPAAPAPGAYSQVPPPSGR